MSIVLKKKTTGGNCFTDPIAVEEYNKSHNASSQFGKSSSASKRFIDINHNLESFSKAAGLTLEAIKNKVLWKKRSVNLTDYDPVYKVIYLGNVLTPWAKGQESVEKPLATLWKNYCLNVKHEIIMKLTICNSGLKAITREHGLTEYWSNRITFCTTHAKYPRVFCWVYRHEGKKLKHELRCHAVLCNKDIEASDARAQLTSRLSIALAEFRREKRMKQNTRLLLSKAYQCHQLICSEHNNVHENHHNCDDVNGDICQRRGHHNNSICRTALLTSNSNTSSGASSLNNSTGSGTCTSSLLHHHHHNNVLRNLTMDDSDNRRHHHFCNPSSDSIDSAHGQSDILCLTTSNLCDESTNTEVTNSLISARSSTSSTSSRSSSTSSCSCSAGSTSASLCRCKRSSKKNQSTCTLNSSGANCTGSLFNVYTGKSGNLLIPIRKKHLVKGQANFKPPLERSKSAPRLTSIDEEEDDEVSSLESDESNSNDNSDDEDETVDDGEQVIEEDVGVSLEDETDYVTSINECSLDDEEEDEDDDVDESQNEKDAKPLPPPSLNIEQFCRPQDNHKIIETLPSGRPVKTTYQYVLDTI